MYILRPFQEKRTFDDPFLNVTSHHMMAILIEQTEMFGPRPELDNRTVSQ